MKAYSHDFRQRIVWAVRQGQGVMQVARRFDVSHDGVRRFVDQHHREGHLEPQPRPGRHRKLSGALLDALREQLLANRRLAQHEHAALFFERHGVPLSRATVGRYIERLGLSRKK